MTQRLGTGVRILAGVVAVLTGLTGLTLFALPALAGGTLWPWPLTPLVARYLGGLFLGVAVGATLVTRATTWGEVRILFPPALVFTGLGLVAAILHFGSFNPARLATWLFMALYTGVFAAGLLAYLRYEYGPDGAARPSARRHALVAGGTVAVVLLATILGATLGPRGTAPAPAGTPGQVSPTPVLAALKSSPNEVAATPAAVKELTASPSAVLATTVAPTPPPPLTPSPSATPTQAVAQLTGEWFHNFGRMALRQTGTRVSGSYEDALAGASGTIEGSVAGSIFTGTWSSNGRSGAMTWTLSADGQTFDGLLELGERQRWCGARADAPFPDGCSFAGQWLNKVANRNDCPMTLARVNMTVTGRYCLGEVKGEITSATRTPRQIILDGTWSVEGHPPGKFRFYLLDYNGLQFQGHWRGEGEGWDEWCGWRARSSPPAPCLLV